MLLIDLMPNAPKNGCEILCTIGDEIRVFTVKRPRFQATWRISEGALAIDLFDWPSVIGYFEKIRATDIEISEFGQ